MSKTTAEPLSWAPDQGVYWLRHLKMAGFFGVAAGLVLLLLGNPHAWVGPVAAVLAIGLRAVFLRSEAMSNIWKLAEGHLVSPTGVSLALSTLQEARVVFGDVVLITKTGDKYPIKYLTEPQAVATEIRAKIA